VHADQLASSSLHWNVAVVSSDAKEKEALVEIVGLLGLPGPSCRIVSGGLTVHVWLVPMGSVGLPSTFFTAKVCGPGVRSE
jgi:hypothetical protein